MIHFFGSQDTVFALQTQDNLSHEDIKKLLWLFNSQIDDKFTITNISDSSLKAYFVGPRAAMITPWSTNAVEITQNMGISGIIRIEEFKAVDKNFKDFDPMLSQKYTELNQSIYLVLKKFLKKL